MTDLNHNRRPGQLLLLRHAQSTWNIEGRFTGWTDVPLSAAGRAQAQAAGRAIAVAGIRIDAVFISRLQRSRETWLLLREALPLVERPVAVAWELNERHYGSLQGTGRDASIDRYGPEQVLRWRRGYRERPPQLPVSDPAHPVNDALYADVDPGRLPSGESLQETRHRVVDYYRRVIRPQLAAGRNVLVVSHGNTLRGLVMEIDMLTEAEVEALEIGIAELRLYNFSDEFEMTDCRVLEIADISATRTWAA